MSNPIKFNYRQIIISYIVFFLTPLSLNILNSYINNLTITTSLIYSFQALIIITTNYHLLKEHFNRFFKSEDRLLFIILGILIFVIIFALNNSLIKSYFNRIDAYDYFKYIIFSPLFLISYAILFPINYCTIYKMITDKFSIKNLELVVIIISSILFSLLFVLFYVPFSIELYIRGFIFYFLITACISYLYNQTNSIATSIISFSVVSIIFELVYLFIL